MSLGTKDSWGTKTVSLGTKDSPPLSGEKKIALSTALDK